MYTFVLNLATAFFTVSGFAAVAAADDWNTCLTAEGQTMIDACTRVIDSGKLQGHDLSTGYINRGVGWSANEDYGKAIQDFKEAINNDRDYATAYYDIANVYSIIHDYDQAIKNYDEAISHRPDYPNAFNNRCSVFNILGDYDRAIADCQRAIDLGKKIDKNRTNFFVGLANA